MWVRRANVFLPIFDLKKQKETFKQVRGYFCEAGASCSITPLRSEGLASIPLRSDYSAGEAQQSQDTRFSIENEPTLGVRSFLQSCLKLLRDDRAVMDLQNLIDRCEQSPSMGAAHRAVHQIQSHTRTGREMRLSAQIGDYEMDKVILSLVSFYI